MNKIAFFLLATSLLGSTVVGENVSPLYVWPKYNQKTIDRVAKFLEGETFGYWTLGSIYDEAPQQYATKLGCKYGFFCSSGTSGLHASLMALGLKQGDRVAVPTMTFIRSVTPLIHMGITPVLVDIDTDTGNLDPNSLSKLDDPDIKAIIVVHMWGIPAQMDKIKTIANQKGWKIIEDFSHAHFSKFKDKYVGSIGDIGFCSLQRKKTISVGEGGLIVTNDEDTFLRIKQIVAPGLFDNPSDSKDFSGFGLNMKIAPTAAVLAESLFENIDEIINTRSGSATQLIRMLAKYPHIFEVPKEPDYAKEISWYALRPKLYTSIKKLKEAALGTRWKFKKLSYPMIADHIFWNKNVEFYPFSSGITIANPNDSFPGADKYMEKRISVGVPNLSSNEWTHEEILAWEKELADIVAKISE